VGVGKSSEKSVMGDWIDSCLPNVGMLKFQQTTDRGAVVLTVSGRLDAENVGQLCELLDAVSIDKTVALDLQDLVLADRAVVRLLREFEERKRIVLRNCPSYIRIWMAAEDIQ
jgi:ABC-type transporter Mla MlaB component